MIKPIINPVSQKTLSLIINNLPQSLLLVGSAGVGLCTIAKYIAASNNVKPIVILPEKDEKIDLEKGSINIDIIRKLIDDNKTINDSEKIIIIDYAETMTQQAQNSFLKLLEEPNNKLHFILVASDETKLLPTIKSRTEKVTIQPITKKQSSDLIDSMNVTDAVKKSQLIFMANGLPAEITRLINNSQYFNKRSESVRDARELMLGTTYQKLLIIQRYKDNRELTLRLLSDVLNIIKYSVNTNPKIDTISKIDVVLDAFDQIQRNCNIRLCLTKMVL